MSADVVGRLVIGEQIIAGRVRVTNGLISAVDADPAGAGGPYVVPGFVDLHVHGFGGHSAMDGREALDGMAVALAARGVTTFLPTAVSAPLDALAGFADSVRRWAADADGAQPAGFNLEGPFLAASRHGAHTVEALMAPDDVAMAAIEPLTDGLRLTTVAPELGGALDLIRWLVGRGVVVSLGHSDATLAEAIAGYDAGARSTTHLFNAMSGIDHRAPGLAAAALIRDDAAVELIADGHHVDRALWPLIARAKPSGTLILVSDAIPLAGGVEGRTQLGGVGVEVRAGRAVVEGSDVLAGSVIGLDTAVRNLVDAGLGLPDAVAAASTNPAWLVGLEDRGRIAPGLRADLVELDDGLAVSGVVIGGRRV